MKNLSGTAKGYMPDEADIQVSRTVNTLSQEDYEASINDIREKVAVLSKRAFDLYQQKPTVKLNNMMTGLDLVNSCGKN